MNASHTMYCGDDHACHVTVIISDASIHASHSDAVQLPAACTISPDCLVACHPSCAQERERKERERVVRAKVAASAFARGYLNGIVKSVFQQLQDTGYFYDPVERQVSLLVLVAGPNVHVAR